MNEEEKRASTDENQESQKSLVVWEAEIDAGGFDLQGGRVWVRSVDALNLPPRTTRRGPDEKKGLYDIKGERLELHRGISRGANIEGTHLLLCARNVEYPFWSRTYVLARVRRDATLKYKNSLHDFSGTGLEMVTSTASKIDFQAIVDKRPDLAPFVGEFCFPLYAALREAGF
jgi:hypothetical protein